MFEELQRCLNLIRTKRPVILNLTNYVTMDFMANSLLAIGAAPIMSQSIEEIEELVSIASVINVNIGTLNLEFIALVKAAISLGQKLNKPIILDPVGAGASQIRTQTIINLISKANIVRGNASEIMALYLGYMNTRGVETTNTTLEATSSGIALAKQNNNIIAISGATDIILSKNNSLKLGFGSSLMQYITGMGCTLNAIIAAFQAIEPDSFKAATLATAYFGLCGEQAYKKSINPGTFKTIFIDSLYAPDLNFMQEQLNKLF